MKLGDSKPEGEKSRQFNRELRDMISAITNTVSGKPGSGSVVPGEDEDGVKIVTLAGTNAGATMRREFEDQKSETEFDVLTTYVNSNYQAVNNSIMMRSSHTTNDPGVHLDLSDNGFGKPFPKDPKKGRKMKNHKTGSKSDGNESETSD